MSSWLRCPCGRDLHTNAFCGASVYSLISDEECDRLPESATAHDLFWQGHKTLQCPTCNRLVVLHPGASSPTIYCLETWPETPPLSDSDAAAVSRGFLSATLHPDGDVRCPHCERVFSTRSTASWDGFRHKTCGTFLRLIPHAPNA